jgi:hypothetical protein
MMEFGQKAGSLSRDSKKSIWIFSFIGGYAYSRELLGTAIYIFWRASHKKFTRHAALCGREVN